jgi:hypothetical protein
MESNQEAEMAKSESYSIVRTSGAGRKTVVAQDVPADRVSDVRNQQRATERAGSSASYSAVKQ